VRHGGLRSVAQAGQRHVRHEAPHLGRHADAAQQPLLFGLQVHQRRRGPRLGHDGAGLVAPEIVEAVQRHREGPAADARQHLVDGVGGSGVDVADEAQGEVVVGGVDPARAGEAAPHQGQLVREDAGDLEAREQAGHGTPPRRAPRLRSTGDGRRNTPRPGGFTAAAPRVPRVSCRR
jgi:hypothetical protein